MKKSLITFFSAFFLLMIVSFAVAQEAEPPGKKIFLDQKCNVCHSIDSQSIAKKTTTSKAPDLSNIGSTQNADWIAKFILKEESLNNKKHAKTWTGSKEDLTTLSNWLATLKKAK